MLFNTLQFAVFFCVVLLLYRSAPRSARNGILLGASLVFYALWIPVYLILLLADIGINYALMRAMVRSANPKRYLVASILFTLGLLVQAKYAAMLVTTLAPVLSSGFGWTPEIPDVFLPLGISFYSFQIIALNVDVYLKATKPVESLARYTLFVSFFPQLIAGPILRGNEFLPQLERGGAPSPERNRRGLWLIASGLAKKVILADFLLSAFVNDIFEVPSIATTPFHLVAVYSFAFQIYFDFSGYSDMARGLSLLLGFELPLNFREPYLSKNPAELWRRWHITLSNWLRDYVFILLLGGGSRSAARAGVNLFLTMFLGGLWHGAAWTFAAWGAYHGLLLMLHRFARPLLARVNPQKAASRLSWDALCIFSMFQMWCIGLVFFRASSFEDAWTMLASLLSGNYLAGWPAMQSGLVLLCMLLHGAERWARLELPSFQKRMAEHTWGPLLEGAIFGIIVALAFAMSGSGGEFIYFQF